MFHKILLLLFIVCNENLMMLNNALLLLLLLLLLPFIVCSESLLMLHKVFCAHFERVLSMPSGKVGSLLLTFIPHLDLYSEFIRNHDKATKVSGGFSLLLCVRETNKTKQNKCALSHPHTFNIIYFLSIAVI